MNHQSSVGRLLARIVLAGWVLGGVCGAVGCAKAQAKTVPDGPPLEMPAPPPRVIAPAEEPITTAPAELTDPTPTPPNPNRRPTRRPPSAAEPSPRPEAAPVEPPLPQAAPADARPVEPPPTLQAPGSAAEHPIRERLVVAQHDLARVDYAKLSVDGRAQYEQSKRFIQQAEQALTDQNFVFAHTLADKAATLAAQLLGR